MKNNMNKNKSLIVDGIRKPSCVMYYGYEWEINAPTKYYCG